MRKLLCIAVGIAACALILAAQGTQSLVFLWSSAAGWMRLGSDFSIDTTTSPATLHAPAPVSGPAGNAGPAGPIGPAGPQGPPGVSTPADHFDVSLSYDSNAGGWTVPTGATIVHNVRVNGISYLPGQDYSIAGSVLKPVDTSANSNMLPDFRVVVDWR